MQLRLGAFTATHELPDAMATWKLTELQDYFDKVVPAMTEQLVEIRNKEQKKLRRKSKNGLVQPSGKAKGKE